MLGNFDRHVSPTIQAEPVANVLRPDTVVHRDCRGAALKLVCRVFAIPNPHPERRGDRFAQEGLAGRHREGFDQSERGFAQPAGRGGEGDETPNEVPPVEPFARRNLRWIAECEGCRR